MFECIDRFLRNCGFRTKSYYEDCERIGIQRGKSMEAYLRLVNAVRSSNYAEANRAMQDYKRENKKVYDMEFDLLGLPKLEAEYD